MMNVSVLFARKDSVYKEMGLDCWDIERDARLWPGGNPIIAHPPCRAWGRLRHFAKQRHDEKELALWSVKMIREHGGVLEHPDASQLWSAAELPPPGQTDLYGGYSLCVDQSWWGHKAQKRTLLYIVGVDRKDLPPMPIRFDRIDYVVCSSNRANNRRKTISKKEREATPPAFAEWLLSLALKVKKPENLKTAI